MMFAFVNEISSQILFQLMSILLMIAYVNASNDDDWDNLDGFDIIFRLFFLIFTIAFFTSLFFLIRRLCCQRKTNGQMIININRPPQLPPQPLLQPIPPQAYGTTYYPAPGIQQQQQQPHPPAPGFNISPPPAYNEAVYPQLSHNPDYPVGK